ncbi:MDR family MFS transporter [Streptomyces sp. NPDC059637]|uniref:MDR family MFS transporter n=1 Tax=Streptomyces sp. NPDC059637 TaxID=3347752 RepID=UPI0036C754F0
MGRAVESSSGNTRARAAHDHPPLRRGRIVAALMLTMALAAMDTTIVATAVPQIVGDLGGYTAFAWVFSAYLLAQTVTIPVYGKLADTVGRRPVLLGGVAVFLAGSALCAAAWDMPSLIAFRAVQGLGAGAIQATVLTVSADLYPVEERGRIQAAFSTVWGAAAVTGPLMGGFFADYVSWRWIFLANLPVGAVALWLLVRELHEPRRPPAGQDGREGRDGRDGRDGREGRSRREGRVRVDWAGALLMLCTGFALILALIQGGVVWPWLSGPSLALFAAAAVGVVAVVVVERRAADPVMPMWLWTRRALAGSSITQLCIGVIMIGPMAFLPVYAQEVLGLGPIAAGFVVATMTMGWPLAAALCNRLYLRIGFRDTALIGALTACAAAAWVLALPPRPAVWPLVCATFLLGLGLGLLSPTLVVGAQSVVGKWERGTVTGAVVFSRNLGQSVGAAVLGAISNAVLAAGIADAPRELRGVLPERIDDIGDGLGGGAGLTGEAADYLHRTLASATHAVYLGTMAACVTAVLVLLFVTPRRFAPHPRSTGEAPDTGDAPGPADVPGPGNADRGTGDGSGAPGRSGAPGSPEHREQRKRRGHREHRS